MVNDPILTDWHVVARSEDLQKETPLKVRLLGEDLVLWRCNNQVLAWQDFCPHRGSRLSMGQVADDTLVCPFHGLAYNAEGKCVRIPAHPDLSPPARACVRTYQSQERYGLIWVSLGNPEQDIPTSPEWGDPSYRLFLRGPYHFQASGFRALENFIDIAHFPFVHAGLLGDVDHPVVDDYEVTAEPDGISINNVRVWQSDPDGTGQGGFEIFNYRVLRPLIAYFSKNMDGRILSIFFTLTPVEEEESIGWMSLAMNYGHEFPEDVLRQYQDLIVYQDVPIVGAQRPRRIPLDLKAEFHLPFDRAAIAYRKWLKELGVQFGTI